MPVPLLAQLSTPGTQDPLTGAITLVLAAFVCWNLVTLLVRTTGRAMAAYQAGKREGRGEH